MGLGSSMAQGEVIPVEHGYHEWLEHGTARGAGILVVHGSGVELGPHATQRAGIQVVHASGAGLGPSAAQGAECPAEQSIGSTGLWGEDLAGQLFFY
jgi:hypothetical protein